MRQIISGTLTAILNSVYKLWNNCLLCEMPIVNPIRAEVQCTVISRLVGRQAKDGRRWFLYQFHTSCPDSSTQLQYPLLFAKSYIKCLRYLVGSFHNMCPIHLQSMTYFIRLVSDSFGLNLFSIFMKPSNWPFL